MSRRIASVCLLLSITVPVCSVTLGVLLPSSYTPRELPEGGAVVDQGLESWLAHFAERETVSTSDLQKNLLNEDTVTQLLFDLRSRRNTPRQAIEKAASEALDVLSKYRNENRSPHLLEPYVIEAIYKLTRSNPEWERRLEKNWASLSVRSCPVRRVMKARLSDRGYITNNPTAVHTYLTALRNLRSNVGTREILRPFLLIAPNKTVLDNRDELLALAEDDFALAQVLKNRLDPATRKKLTQATSLQEIRQQAERGSCGEAKTQLKQLTPDSKPTLKSFGDTLDAIAKCYKPYGFKARLGAWQEFTPILQQFYGSDGLLKAKVETARIYWDIDRNSDAKNLLGAVVALDPKTVAREVYAKALFLLGKVEDGTENPKGAIEYYSKFAETLSNDENMAAVLTELVLLYAGQEDWEQTAKYAEKLALLTSEQPAGSIDISILGFALFWSGRALVEIGKTQEGIAQWQRLASECFSTYYGALGHFMLERTMNKQYALQPFYSSPFSENVVSHTFIDEDQTIALRALALLKLDQREDSACEVRELDAANSAGSKLLVKALLLHASGEWLESIKLYGGIPHADRKTFPVGTERLLFPRKFEDKVELYAKRLDLDPDFIFSLIRQESVFDPEAMSVMGAKGLMQLMIHTAQSEAKSLREPYVNLTLRTKILSASRRPDNLFDPETNIVLGIHHLDRLFRKYDNTALTLSAYNAGATNANRWIKKYPTSDLLYFIERIPYQETRNYVKLILRNYFYYKRWYRSSNSDFSLFQNILQSLPTARSKPGENVKTYKS